MDDHTATIATYNPKFVESEEHVDQQDDKYELDPELDWDTTFITSSSRDFTNHN